MKVELQNTVGIINTEQERRGSLTLAAKTLHAVVADTCRQVTAELAGLRGEQPALVVSVTPLLSASLMKAPPRWFFQIQYQGECLLRVDCSAKGEGGSPIATISDAEGETIVWLQASSDMWLRTGSTEVVSVVMLANLIANAIRDVPAGVPKDYRWSATWEYRVESLLGDEHFAKAEHLQARLNELGAAGWELVDTAYVQTLPVTFFLKRQVPPPGRTGQPEKA